MENGISGSHGETVEPKGQPPSPEIVPKKGWQGRTTRLIEDSSQIEQIFVKRSLGESTLLEKSEIRQKIEESGPIRRDFKIIQSMTTKLGFDVLTSRDFIQSIRRQKESLLPTGGKTLERHTLRERGHEISVLVSSSGNVFIEGKEVATGSSKAVSFGIDFFSGEQVAILKSDITKPKNRKVSENEAEILKEFKGEEGIVQTHEVHYTSLDGVEQQVIIQKFYQGGDLKNWLKSNPSRDRTEKIDNCLDVLKGIQKVHKKNYLHYDLKPDNIYVGEDGKLVVGYFGSAFKNEEGTSVVSGSLGYMSPGHLREVLEGKTCTPKVEVSR